MAVLRWACCCQHVALSLALVVAVLMPLTHAARSDILGYEPTPRATLLFPLVDVSFVALTSTASPYSFVFVDASTSVVHHAVGLGDSTTTPTIRQIFTPTAPDTVTALHVARWSDWLSVVIAHGTSVSVIPDVSDSASVADGVPRVMVTAAAPIVGLAVFDTDRPDYGTSIDELILVSVSSLAFVPVTIADPSASAPGPPSLAFGSPVAMATLSGNTRGVVALGHLYEITNSSFGQVLLTFSAGQLIAFDPSSPWTPFPLVSAPLADPVAAFTFYDDETGDNYAALVFAASQSIVYARVPSRSSTGATPLPSPTPVATLTAVLPGASAGAALTAAFPLVADGNRLRGLLAAPANMTLSSAQIRIRDPPADPVLFGAPSELPMLGRIVATLDATDDGVDDLVVLQANATSGKARFAVYAAIVPPCSAVSCARCIADANCGYCGGCVLANSTCGSVRAPRTCPKSKNCDGADCGAVALVLVLVVVALVVLVVGIICCVCFCCFCKAKDRRNARRNRDRRRGSREPCSYDEDSCDGGGKGAADAPDDAPVAASRGRSERSASSKGRAAKAPVRRSNPRAGGDDGAAGRGGRAGPAAAALPTDTLTPDCTSDDDAGFPMERSRSCSDAGGYVGEGLTDGTGDASKPAAKPSAGRGQQV